MACSRGTYVAFFTMTSASSTFQSTFFPFRVMTKASLGPTRDVVDLKKMTGSLGISILLSAAWSRKFKPIQTILLGRQIGDPRRTEDATRGAEALFFCNQ